MTARWQQKRVRPDHADDWLMTYADMITLLLCFFAIVIIASVPKKLVHPDPPVLSAVAQPQHLPPALPQPKINIFADNLPFHAVDQTADRAESTPEFLPIKDVEAPVIVPLVATIAVAVPPPPPALVLDKVVDAVKPPEPVSVERKGERVTAIELNSATFFAVGSATLSNAGKVVLLSVATQLKSNQFEGYRITVEGYTDDTPIHTPQFPSNWELSTARASAVVHFFLEQGIPASRLRAVGYGDTFPKVPNRDGNGNPIPANQAENRRVVIRLEKIDKN